MQRSLLFVLDGESLRTPGLTQILDRDGWAVEWLDGGRFEERLAAGTLPDLLLFDPATVSDPGLAGLASVKRSTPGLQVVALGAAGQEEGRLRAAGLEPTAVHRLARTLATESWPATLRSCLGGFGPGAQKFTAEDLFGDILADMGEAEFEAPAPAPVSVPAPAPAPAMPAPVPAVALPVAAAPAPVPAASVPVPAAPAPVPPAPAPVPPAPAPVPPAPAPVPPAPAPVPTASAPVPAAPAPVPAAPAPVPAVAAPFVWPPVVPPPPPPAEPAPDLSVLAAEGAPGLSALFARIMEDAPDAASQTGSVVLEGKDYTLSGIAGIQDPFGTHGGSRPAAPPPPRPVVQAPAPADEGLEEFGNYYLLEKIAVGGMAELFKARQRGVHNFEKIVAIKRILPHLSDNDEFVRMFIDEAKLAAQLTHPNIAQIFDLGKAGGFYYIAMEFVDGRDLRSLLRKVREYKLPLPEPVAAAVTMKVANALDYAHRERGINDRELKLVHRDISPQNILISYDGGVKLVDFGIAKAATKSTQTMAGALKGKLLYMSPEQALGQPVDGRSDLYSLGLVLFELLTGERCFQADSEMGVLEKVRLGKVMDVRENNPAISAEMAAIMDKVLQKNLPQRYASARLLERDLKALLVKRHNEPTEHEIAEYVNTLLKGTREELVDLLATHFPPPPPTPVPEPQPAPPRGDDAPTVPAGRVPARAAAPLGLPPEPAMAAPGRPAWVIPALAALVLGVALAAWALLR